MSASLIVLIPIILLGIVGMLCFTGCGLDSHGTAQPFFSYTPTTVLNNPAVIAYWPLKEAKDTDPASELISGNTGNYIDQNTAPPSTIYPWPSYSVPNGANPDVLSADAPGTIMQAQPSIVTGDVILPQGDTVAPACMVVNGCYVEVPFNVKFSPATSFTVEVWVRLDWTADDQHAFRFVLDMREISPATAGFGICALAVDGQPGVYKWRGIIGDGSATFSFADSSEALVTLRDPAASAGTVTYLALTYDGASKTLTLFIDGSQQAQVTNVAYLPNATQPLWIGAGAPYVARRTQPTDPMNPTSPLFPFVGAIQDVAIYSAALAPDVIGTHHLNGTGLT
jgi:hypothetical protein